MSAEIQGRTVYENRQLRNGSATENLITYYAYDDCGRLTWVVTPKGSDLLSAGSSFSPESDFARQNCYIYFYDEWGRVYEKRFPGREPMYIVYNRGDRPMMIQDGLMREKNQWLTFHYDGAGRITFQRLATDSGLTPLTRETLQMSFDTSSYPQLYPSPASQILTQHVYDRYPTTMPAALAFEEIPDMTWDLTGIEPETLLDTSTTGLPTYEKLTAITDSSIGGEYHRAYYYDYKGREIQRVECDFEGNILRTTSRYDLIGNLLAKRESYTHGGTTDVLDRTFEYDSRSRMTKETAQFNDGEQAVVAYTYDDLGQLTGKTYGTGAHAIHETMDYNMQGWLTEKSSELFEMRLRYHDPESHLSDRASYTGNISSWWWKHRLINNDNDSENRLYAFTYDDLARLVDTELYLDDSYSASNEFVENGITYDKNSNIITLNRSGLSQDDIKGYRFSYSGNQRIKDEASNSDYEYDANGNIHRDALTGFYIYYNLLNLPTVIYTEGDMGLYYTYLSDGTKIEVCGYDDSEPTRYIGSLVYNDGTFESASFGGGRIVGTNNGANSEVHYFLTDHLGSTRVVAKVTPTGREDLDRKDYYPFGKEWTQSGMPTSDNRYTFSGKEQQHLRGQVVNYADFEARFYDSETGIFLQQDPLSEYSFQVSPYAYCGNNPINRIDLDGKRWDDPIQDAEIARQIKDAINAALNALISQEKRINNRINKINDNTKLSQEKKEERVAKEKQKLAEIDIQQDNLTYLSEGIDKMGSEDNPNIFTFETVEDEDGLTSTNTDGVTTMRNNGTFYNRVHEATHGAQIALGDLRVNQNGQALGGLSTPAREIQAYQNQAVLAGYETLPFSDHGGRPTKLKGITAPWIKGIKNSNGQYVY